MNRIDDLTIERYLGGEMDAAEQAAFRAQMASDPALRRRVTSEQSMLDALRVDRDATRRDHAEVRSRVLASIPRIAPASGVQQAKPSRGWSLKWPIIGTLLLVGAWIAIDVVTFENPVGLPGTTTGANPRARASDDATQQARPARQSAGTEGASGTGATGAGTAGANAAGTNDAAGENDATANGSGAQTVDARSTPSATTPSATTPKSAANQASSSALRAASEKTSRGSATQSVAPQRVRDRTTARDGAGFRKGMIAPDGESATNATSAETTKRPLPKVSDPVAKAPVEVRRD